MKRTQADLVRILSERVGVKEKWRLERIQSLKNVKEMSQVQLERMNRIKTRKSRKLVGLRSMDQQSQELIDNQEVSRKSMAAMIINEGRHKSSNNINHDNSNEIMDNSGARSERYEFAKSGHNSVAIRGHVTNSPDRHSADEMDRKAENFPKAKITYEQIPVIVRRNKRFINKTSSGNDLGTVKFSTPFFNVPTLSNSLKKLKKELDEKKRKPLPVNWISKNFQSSTEDVMKLVQPLAARINSPKLFQKTQMSIQPFQDVEEIERASSPDNLNSEDKGPNANNTHTDGEESGRILFQI